MDHSLNLTIRTVNAASRSIDIIASTSSLDSYDEIVEQEWDLRRYATNPVVLFAHDSRALPVGTATNVRVEGGKLQATVKFASKEANPLAEQAWKLVQEGILRGVSVGFQSHEKRYEKRNGKDVRVLSKNELYEISLVPVPANSDAATKSASSPVTDTRGAPPVKKPSRLLQKAREAAKAASADADYKLGKSICEHEFAITAAKQAGGAR